MIKLSNMTFSIRFKLFTTLLLTTGSVVLCMYLMMLWSFDRGFLDYVNKQEQQKYQALSQALAKHWQKNKSWEQLSNNHRSWDILLSQHIEFPESDFKKGRPPGSDGRMPRSFGPPDDFKRPPPFKHDDLSDHRPPPPKGNSKPLLLDENKKILIGLAKNLINIELYEILVEDKIVGFVGQFPQKKLADELDVLFVEQQSQAFMLSAIMMVIISVLAALPIAAHLVKPIRLLSKGTQRLISGRYQTVIPVTSNDELGQLSKNFNSLANTLKENEKARQQWIADISHELSTPLAILKGEIEAMQDGIRETTPQAIDSLHAEVEHLNNLMKDLYELSMSDIGALNYQKEKTDIVNVLQVTLDSFRTEFENAGLTLRFNSKLKKNPSVLADATRLRQLFSNLLKNTLRYTDREGTLEVEISAGPNEVNIQFKDSAPGVSETEIARLFERLYRVESSRNRATGGAGLGLSVCHNIIAAHDGTISAKASPYGGIWISISLPILGFNKDAHKKREAR